MGSQPRLKFVSQDELFTSRIEVRISDFSTEGEFLTTEGDSIAEFGLLAVGAWSAEFSAEGKEEEGE